MHGRNRYLIIAKAFVPVIAVELTVRVSRQGLKVARDAVQQSVQVRVLRGLGVKRLIGAAGVATCEHHHRNDIGWQAIEREQN